MFKAPMFVKNIRKIELLAAVAALAIVLLLFMKNASNPKDGGEEGTALERRLTRVLQRVEGVGRVQVLVNERQAAASLPGGGTGSEITGVVIVADGAGDLVVALKLQLAAKTLLNVDLDQIEVFEMQGGG